MNDGLSVVKKWNVKLRMSRVHVNRDSSGFAFFTSSEKNYGFYCLKSLKVLWSRRAPKGSTVVQVCCVGSWVLVSFYDENSPFEDEEYWIRTDAATGTNDRELPHRGEEGLGFYREKELFCPRNPDENGWIFFNDKEGDYSEIKELKGCGRSLTASLDKMLFRDPDWAPGRFEVRRRDPITLLPKVDSSDLISLQLDDDVVTSIFSDDNFFLGYTKSLYHGRLVLYSWGGEKICEIDLQCDYEYINFRVKSCEREDGSALLVFLVLGRECEDEIIVYDVGLNSISWRGILPGSHSWLNFEIYKNAILIGAMRGDVDRVWKAQEGFNWTGLVQFDLETGAVGSFNAGRKMGFWMCKGADGIIYIDEDSKELCLVQ